MIYVRHGDDENLDAAYPNDPSLVESSYWSIKRLTRRLLLKFGRPDAIYVSPMRRTWETALIMEEVLHRKVPLILDCHLSRFFTRSQRDLKTIRPDTLKRKVPIDESKKQFRSRIDRHIEHLFPCYSVRRPLVWCITHALVMKRIAKKVGVALKGRFDFLETFVVPGGKIEVTRGQGRKDNSWRSANGSSRTAPSGGGSVARRPRQTVSVLPALKR